MFSDFFVFMGDSDDSGERPRYRYSRKQKCPPTTEVINVTLEDLYNGKEKTFKVTKNAECEECKGTGSIKYPSQKCVTCHGKGKYAAKIENGKNNKKKKGGNTYQKHCARCDGRGRIEAFTSKCQNCNGKSIVRAAKCYKVNLTRGMRDQQSITFTGQGDQKDGMEAGDLVFVIKCKKHDIFERKGDDLVIEKKIELSEALCGTSVVIQHIDGKTFVVQREQFSGDLSDLSCRVKNKGMPIPCTNGKYGSLIIKFEVVFPPSYFFQDESLYKELEEALPPKPKAEPISEDSEEVTLYEYDKDRYKHADKDRNAYDSDEVEEEEDFGGPQCRVH